MQTFQPRQSYDYRIREAICETGDRDLFPELNIPRSTIRSWVRRGVPDVVTCDLALGDRSDLVVEIRELRHRTALLGAVVGLLIAMLRVSKISINHERLPNGDSKRVLLRAIERAGKVMPLNAALRIARLSSSRYHSWCRGVAGCDLNDQPSCPRVVPTRLTPKEVDSMREMVESSDHRHMSLRGLALHAQRIGKVIASPTTWYRLVRESGWRRPRNRIYPAKPKVGIRASAPGELLHLDVTIIKLIDGTRAYLHAVIDNYSRRILSWTLEDRLGSGATCSVLRKAAGQILAGSKEPTVVVDSGSENVNREVDDLLEGVDLTRVLAQVEVTFSNSMIEAFWRSLKHSWIYLHTLDSFTALHRLIEFYVTAHNEVMPHSAFQGETPDEMYFGTGGAVAFELGIARRTARDERMKANRAARCGVCIEEGDSRALQLQRPNSRMF
ncbi:MAG: DDE-type integrase/transposase/recombinase [Chloroflexi bacterium]|nr:DDE-type integrase/transposase/recombinase [Chloroflexota bacterium]